MEPTLDLLSLSAVNIDATDAITATATETAAAMETKVTNLRASVDDALTEQRAAREVELKALSLAERQTARKIEEKVWNDKRRTLIRETQEKNAEAVEKHLQALHQSKAKLQSLEALVGGSPAHLLTTVGTTGSDKSGIYMQTVNQAQPGVIAQLARKAIAEGNVELGQAIAARLSTMEAKARPVPIQDLARALVGDRHQLLSTSVRDALDRVEDGLQVCGQWMMGRSATPQERISRGLRSYARATQDEQAIGRGMRK